MSGISQKFLSSEGLMPSTIFDRDPDMDVSEEMEEIREILYALIKKHFPMGVSSTHLAEKYREEYVSVGLGRDLPSDWLDQVTAAEEFEAQIRGPLTILFVRLNNTSSFKRPQVPHTNVKIISSTSPQHQNMLEANVFHPANTNNGVGSQSSVSPIASRKSPHDLAKQFQFCVLDLDWSTSRDVIATHVVNAGEFWLRSADDAQLKRLHEKMNEFYEKNADSTIVQAHEVCANGAYAALDDENNWQRTIALSTESNGEVDCLLVDIGTHQKFTIDRLRFLTCPLADTPSLAARCALEVSSSLVQCAETTAELKNMIMDRDGLGNYVPKVIKACLLSVADGRSARRVCVFTPDGRNVKDELLELSSPGKENKQIGFVRAAPATPLVPLSTSSISTTSPLPMASMFCGESVIEPMMPQEMPSKPFTAHALFAAGPADISLRQASLDPMPDYMYQRLADECETAGSNLTETPRQGRFYAAKIDDRWERVICVRSSKIDPSAFCVYLIDVGAFHYVRGDAMRLLNSQTPFKKMLMFKAKVAGIAPVGGQDVWSRESHLAVREFFEACQGEPVEVVAQTTALLPRGATPPSVSPDGASANGWTSGLPRLFTTDEEMGIALSPSARDCGTNETIVSFEEWGFGLLKNYDI